MVPESSIGLTIYPLWRSTPLDANPQSQTIARVKNAGFFIAREAMTDPEFERRLRHIEDWQLRHDEKCNGREEKIVLAIETLAKSTAASITDLEETLGELDGRSIRMASSQGKRLRAVELQMAFARGWMVAAAAMGGLLGGILSSVFGYLLK